MENTTQTPQITVQDLDTIRGIIDLAAKRGAFSAGEASSIGAVYDKLTAFLSAVAAQAKAAQDAAAAEAESDIGTSTADETAQGE